MFTKIYRKHSIRALYRYLLCIIVMYVVNKLLYFTMYTAFLNANEVWIVTSAGATRPPQSHASHYPRRRRQRNYLHKSCASTLGATGAPHWTLNCLRNIRIPRIFLIVCVWLYKYTCMYVYMYLVVTLSAAHMVQYYYVELKHAF